MIGYCLQIGKMSTKKVPRIPAIAIPCMAISPECTNSLLRFLTKEGALFLREKIKVFTTPAKTLKDPESISKFLYTFVYALRVTSVYSFSVLN